MSCIAFQPFGSVAVVVGTYEEVKRETESLVCVASRSVKAGSHDRGEGKCDPACF